MSIEKRGKTYSQRVWVEDGSTGRRHQRRLTATTKGELRRNVTELQRASDVGTVASPGRLPFQRYVQDRWLPHVRTRTRARTSARYEELLRRHVLPRVGSIPLGKIRRDQVRAVIDGMLADGLAPTTALHGYRVLSEALADAVRWGLIAVNPAQAIRPPRPDRPRLEVPDAAGVTRILAAAEGDRLHAALVVAATTGLRRGEVLALTWRPAEGVDLEAGLARVTATLQRVRGELRTFEPKTDRSRRTVALPAFTVATLRPHRRAQAERRLLAGEAWQDRGLVFDRGDGGPVDPAELSIALKRAAKRAGLPRTRLHDLRHAFATTLLAAGIHPKVASEALGHASVGFTMDVYSHVLPTMQEEAARAIQAALGGAMAVRE